MKAHENEPERDPFLCTCGPCKKFWRDTFSDSADLLRESSTCRAHNTSILSTQSRVVKVGDRVIVHAKYPGTVKWVGVLDEDSIAPELYVGVRLDDNVNSTHNGMYNGKRYFHVPRGHGAMVKYTDVVPVKMPEKKPPLQGNYMFPSWDEVQRRRKERNQKLQSLYASAGMVGPQFVEPYITVPKSHPQSASTSRGTSPIKSKKEPIIHIGDPHDIAIRDLERKSVIDVKRKTHSKADNEKKEMEVLTQQFGGGEEGERLAMTVRKLRMAQKEGRAFQRHHSNRDFDSGSEYGMGDH